MEVGHVKKWRKETDSISRISSISKVKIYIVRKGNSWKTYLFADDTCTNNYAGITNDNKDE